MTSKLTTAAAALLLLAGASGAALAQEHDHDRTSGQSAQPHPQGQQPPHAGGPPGGGNPGGGNPGGGRGQGAPQGLAKPPVGGPQAGVQHGPYGEHGPSGATGYQGHGSQGERYQAQGGAGGPPRGETNGPNGYRPYPGAGRPYEHATGPHEVIPPGADHGHDNRYEGHMAGGPPDHNGYAPGRPPGPPQRWAPGRYPSVYDSHQRYHADIYRPPYGYYVRPWNAGEFLPRTWFVQSYWLTDFIDFGLPYPPPGFTWVRVGPDAIMIDQYTGRIVQVVHSVFW